MIKPERSPIGSIISVRTRSPYSASASSSASSAASSPTRAGCGSLGRGQNRLLVIRCGRAAAVVWPA